MARLVSRYPSFSDRLIPIEPSEPYMRNGPCLRVTPTTQRHLPPDPHLDVGDSVVVSFRAVWDCNGFRFGREELSLTPESCVQLAKI